MTERDTQILEAAARWLESTVALLRAISTPPEVKNDCGHGPESRRDVTTMGSGPTVHRCMVCLAEYRDGVLVKEAVAT